MNFFTKPISDDLSVDPRTWILLADDALSAGRTDQAEELVGQAYRMYDERAYDEAITNAARCWLGSGEEEPKVYPK